MISKNHVFPKRLVILLCYFITSCSPDKKINIIYDNGFYKAEILNDFNEPECVSSIEIFDQVEAKYELWKINSINNCEELKKFVIGVTPEGFVQNINEKRRKFGARYTVVASVDQGRAYVGEFTQNGRESR